jgi:hypothetical protein
VRDIDYLKDISQFKGRKNDRPEYNCPQHGSCGAYCYYWPFRDLFLIPADPIG